MLKFEISDADQERVDKWLKETVFPAVIAKQKESFKESEISEQLQSIASSYWDQGYPYAGAIGGGLTYHFTNTSIGQVQKVTYGEHELDLSDYASW